MDGDAAVSFRGVSRSFGETRALDSLDMTVGRGDIYGFLGRNGAGKTTAIRVLAGLIRCDSGEVRLMERDAAAGDPSVRGTTGFLVESPAFFSQLNGFDNLVCHLYLMGRRDLAGAAGREQVDRFLRLFGLENAARRKVGGYSLGMRQRLGLAQAFLGDPEVIALDEPANGLDPEGVIAVRGIIRRFVEEKGTTFLISSHILGEMEQLCTRVGIIEKGRMAAEGTLAELGATGRVIVKVTDSARGLVFARERFPECAPRSRQAGGFQLTLAKEGIPRLVRELVEAGFDVQEVSAGTATLEELFLELTGSGGSL